MGQDAFADPDELRMRLGLSSLTPAQNEQADALLRDASSLIRSKLGLTVNHVTGDVAAIPAPYGNVLVLPEVPAQEPTEVRVNGQLVGDWTFDVTSKGRGSLTRAAGWQAFDSVTGALLPVEVTYSHGFTDVPDEVVRVCCQAAIRAFTNPSGVLRSEPRGDFNVSYDTTTPGVYLTDGELKDLKHAVGLPTAGSVSVSS